MSTETKNMKLKDLIAEMQRDLDSSFNTLWTVLTKWSIHSMEHCNSSTHSPDFILAMANKVHHHSNGGGVYLAAYKKAVKAICARELSWDNEKETFVSKFDPDLWKKIEANDHHDLKLLKEKGLGAFKPKRSSSSKGKGSGKNGPVIEGEVNISAADLGSRLQKLHSDFPDNNEVKELEEKLVKAYAEKAKADLKPDGEAKETESKVNILASDLSKLTAEERDTLLATLQEQAA